MAKRVYIYYTPAGSHIALDMLKAWLKGNNINSYEHIDMDVIEKLVEWGCMARDKRYNVYLVADLSRCRRRFELPSGKDELYALFVDEALVPLGLRIVPRDGEELKLASDIMERFREIEYALS